MRVVHKNNRLPEDWAGIFRRKGFRRLTPDFIGYVRVSAGSRLRMPVLVFPNKTRLQGFWTDVLFRPGLGRDCVGAVNSLATFVTDFSSDPPRERMAVDRSFFAVMGLVRSHLSMEIICHESVHAGIAYAMRLGGRSEFSKAHDFEEEHLAYPVGRIASGVNRLLHDNGMY